jgi:hypothetical protein
MTSSNRCSRAGLFGGLPVGDEHLVGLSNCFGNLFFFVTSLSAYHLICRSAYDLTCRSVSVRHALSCLEYGSLFGWSAAKQTERRFALLMIVDSESWMNIRRTVPFTGRVPCLLRSAGVRL